MQKMTERELLFDVLDADQAFTATCSACGQQFVGKHGPRHDDIILEMRAQFDQHECRNHD